ncbi:MAG TPA: SUF system NifU family Fe-S cluster assembly protein [Actinomycetales bacterium]|nr:SUF system NifU family Fe-S cluster assembly protein [Actinomycetales bacterium]
MSMDALYQEIILDHARSPHGAGLRTPFDVEVHHVNPTCGDDIRLRVRLDRQDAAGPWTVADVSYEALGCSISTAGTSVMTDLVTGREVREALARYADMRQMLQTRDSTEPDPEVLGDAVAFAGVAKFPARITCALLGWAALADAVSQAVDSRTHADPHAPRVDQGLHAHQEERR